MTHMLAVISFLADADGMIYHGIQHGANKDFIHDIISSRNILDISLYPRMIYSILANIVLGGSSVGFIPSYKWDFCRVQK